MSARPSPLAARLRRELEARGLTPSPTCPACGRQHDPNDFAPSGVCRACEAERRAVSDAWDQEQAEAIRSAAFGDLGLREEA